jgi:hypothetical protein
MRTVRLIFLLALLSTVTSFGLPGLPVRADEPLTSCEPVSSPQERLTRK